jgi:hypothetical protein
MRVVFGDFLSGQRFGKPIAVRKDGFSDKPNGVRGML